MKHGFFGGVAVIPSRADSEGPPNGFRITQPAGEIFYTATSRDAEAVTLVSSYDCEILRRLHGSR